MMDWTDQLEELSGSDTEDQQQGRLTKAKDDAAAKMEVANYSRIVESPHWTQSISPGRYYTRSRNGIQMATASLNALHNEFEQRVLSTIRERRQAQPKSDPPLPSATNCFHNNCSSHHCNEHANLSDSSISSSDDDHDDNDDEDDEGQQGNEQDADRKASKRARSETDGQEKLTFAQKEIQRKRSHPAALHPDIGFNESGQLNDGPLCKCSWAAKQTGVRHNKFAGEHPFPVCDSNSSNIDQLHHYVLLVDPSPAKFSRRTTQIRADGHTYRFEGFSLFFHSPLPEQFPQQPINQWTQQFRIRLVRENVPESFTMKDLELFHSFLFDHILEMYDHSRLLNLKGEEGQRPPSCPFYHCMPRFARELADGGKELLPMSSVLSHFTSIFAPLIDSDKLAKQLCSSQDAFLKFAQHWKGQIFLNPDKKPGAIRVDLIDVPPSKNNNNCNSKSGAAFDPKRHFFPSLVHFGVKPSAFSFLRRPQYQEAVRKHLRLKRQLFAKMSTCSAEERQRLRESEANLHLLRREIKSKRETTILIDSKGFYRTGIYPDVVQHALLLILTCQHVRLHSSLADLEVHRMGYKFKNRSLLELALTHPSFRSNYGTNSDHAKNVINNCGLRIEKIGASVNGQNGFMNKNGGRATPMVQQSESSAAINGNSFVAFPSLNSSGFQQRAKQGRRRGIQVLMEIMAMQGSKHAEDSPVKHNERLEFLGDAVVEFLTTVHLFFLFTELDEGGLATYRSALVQNRHLATLADRLGLQHFMLYAHGPDLCHEVDLRHAMANTFEALMAAVFLDGGLEDCDRIFATALHRDEPPALHTLWTKLPEHPLKSDNPYGDRHLIESIPCLKLLTQFEQSIGIRFNHIRLLAKALTRRNVPYNFLTLGNNQRLEFLGDTVLQLLTSEYLYLHFPHHQEGHLSLLRTCLVSNRTQSLICDELSMPAYLVIPTSILRKHKQAQLRIKDKADLVEAFMGALFVDRGLAYCRQFCRVCFFPRLKHFILTQSWNDPKSQLQQCCLTLRNARGGQPDIPEYRTIGIEGPTNTRVYRVAVYYRSKRIAEGTGPNVHFAQMQAAENALANHPHLFSPFSTSKHLPK